MQDLVHSPRMDSRTTLSKCVLLAATALGSVLACSPAFAQEATPLPDTPAQASASGAAANNQAQPSSQLPTTTTQGAPQTPGGSSSDQVQEIVVTAQFHAQNLQSTPLAITALTGDQLAQKGLTSTQDLTQVAPSVELRHTGSAGGKTLAAFIRGVGASDYNFNVEPGVAFYADDVYLGPSFGTLLEFIDLERVEVLRGPQGTLSGKNAIGGAIRLVTQKPKGDNSGYIEAETGSRSLIRLRAAYDVPLADNLAMRVSGYAERQDGLVKLLDFGCVNPTLTGDQSAPYSIHDRTPPQDCKRGSLGNTNVAAGRLQFRWTPSANLEVNLSGDYVKDDARGASDTLLYVNPAGFANYFSPAQIAAQTTNPGSKFATTPFFQYYYGVPYDTRFLPPSRYTSYATFNDPVYGLNYPPKNTLTTKDLTLNVDWKVADDISLTSITGYRSIYGSWAYDSDSSPLQTDGVYDTQGHKQFSEELRLSGTSFDDRLTWTLGGFYFHAKERDIGSIQAAVFNFYIAVNSFPKYTNYAGFAHAEYKLTDQLTLIGGLRESHENKNYHFIENDVPGTPSNAFPGGLDVPAKTKYSRFDYRAGLQYQIDPRNMIYADISTGYRGGGFNPRPSNLQTVTEFGPESLTSYEIGQRSEFFDRKVRWNNTAYYSDYKDIQLSGRITSIVSGGSFPVTVLTNAAKARIWGLESELQADVTHGLSFNASGSYTNFKYQDLGPAAVLAATSGPTLDSEQRFTPKWKFNVGTQWTIPVLEELGDLTFNADYTYQTKQSPDARNLPELVIPAYGLANARLTFKTHDDWQISLIGTNIFDKHYFYNKNYVSGNFQIKGNPAPGAEWALALKKSF